MVEDPSDQVDRFPIDRFLAVLPPLGLFFYGIGWVFYNRVYSEFGISAEQAGVSFDYLAVRSVALLGSAVAALFVVSTFYHRRHDHTARAKEYKRSITFCVIGFAALVAVSGYAALKVLLRHWLWVGGSETGWTLTAAAIAVAIFCGTWLSITWTIDIPNFRQRNMSVRHGAGMVFLLGIMALLWSAALGTGVGDNLYAGHSQDSFYLSVPAVHIVKSDEILGSRCGLLLGDANGVDVLYLPKKSLVILLPTDMVVLEIGAGCS
jgi:predicted membrane channel-forming protein YqfA (hemolysin III family)